MSKKRKRTGRCAAERARRAATRQARAAGRDGVLWRQTAEEATLAAKPRYNGYACGHGPHGDTRYNRARAKQAWHRQIGQEGASRGSFPFSGRGTAGAPRCDAPAPTPSLPRPIPRASA